MRGHEYSDRPTTGVRLGPTNGDRSQEVSASRGSTVIQYIYIYLFVPL